MYICNRERLEFTHLQLERIAFLYHDNYRESTFKTLVFREMLVRSNIIVSNVDKLEYLMFDDSREMRKETLIHYTMIQTQYPNLLRSSFAYNKLMFMADRIAQELSNRL
jgi:hypothetical protein